MRYVQRGYRGSECFFFFSSRRRHTRFDCDWSSDVCSSDLECTTTDTVALRKLRCHHFGNGSIFRLPAASSARQKSLGKLTESPQCSERADREIGRASCRERV